MVGNIPKWLLPLLKALRACVVVIGHIILAAVVVVSIWCLNWLTAHLWGHEEPKLFDICPLSYVFDAAMLGMLIVFIGWGVWEAHKAMKDPLGKDDKDDTEK